MGDFFQGLQNRIGIVGELFSFFWKRKLWWLIPMMLVLILMGGLILFAQNAAIAPFVYTIF